jgi:hypothetical protein
MSVRSNPPKDVRNKEGKMEAMKIGEKRERKRLLICVEGDVDAKRACNQSLGFTER